MYYRMIKSKPSRYTDDIGDIADFVGSLSPDQEPLLQGLADTAVRNIEAYIGSAITKQSIRLVFTRGESELNDAYAKSWLTSAQGYASYMTGTNQWIELPCPAESIDAVYLTQWGNSDPIPLVLNQDYTIDTFSKYPRVSLGAGILIQDLFQKYQNVIIDITGGLYDVDGSMLPEIKTAINCYVKDLYENRGDGEARDPLQGTAGYLVRNIKASSIA